MKMRLIVCGAGMLASLLLSSCMASKGLGQDMQILGEKIERKADQDMGATPPPSAGAYVAPPL